MSQLRTGASSERSCEAEPATKISSRSPTSWMSPARILDTGPTVGESPQIIVTSEVKLLHIVDRVLKHQKRSAPTRKKPAGYPGRHLRLPSGRRVGDERVPVVGSSSIREHTGREGHAQIPALGRPRLPSYSLSRLRGIARKSTRWKAVREGSATTHVATQTGRRGSVPATAPTEQDDRTRTHPLRAFTGGAKRVR